MATVEQIKQEFLDLFNKKVADHNATPESERPYYWYECEEVDSFTEALQGNGDIDGLFDQIGWGDGVTLPSGKVSVVKQWGDTDGEITVILGIGEQYFQLTGWYSSWDGNDFSETVTEVEPKEVTVVRFFPKKG